MKIAFCFLTQDDLHHPEIWQEFFANVASNQFNLYCHPKRLERVVSTLLARRILHDRVATKHGDISIVEATLALFAAAYKDDPDNQYFVLISESTIPVAPFSQIWDELANCGSRSLIPYSVPLPGTEHHARLAMIENKAMFANPFYYHDQWIVLHRRHVDALLGRSYLPLFSRVFAPDEHYIMNVLVHANAIPLEQIINRRTTFANWQEHEAKLYLHPETRQILGQTFHPKTYSSIAPQDLRPAHNDWFFRKVSVSCDCSLVLDRIRS